MNEEPKTVNAKYIFIDIVRYTFNRSVEAQTDLVRILNQIVNESVNKYNVPKDLILYIPTGDGICICLLDFLNPYDIHLLIALEILERVSLHSDLSQDEMRKFSLRVGINENIDNLITDINNQRNIAGSGINYAQRIMSLSDSNQILVGSGVFEKLSQREKYMNYFIRFNTTITHNISITVYQYKNEKLSYINNDVPSLFKKKELPQKKFSRIVAYYIAHSLINENFSVKKMGPAKQIYSLIITYFYLAQDSLSQYLSTRTDPPRKKLEREKEKQFDYLETVDFWVICDLADLIKEKYLTDYSEYFEDSGFVYVNKSGKQKLIQEFPDICGDFLIVPDNIFKPKK